MHPEADALLDAIFDAPDDDTPRLVYADWLQEHGQEAYAQFIRLQCAAAREPFWSAEANRLWEEIGRVWTRLDEEWWPATRGVWTVRALVPYYDVTQQPFGAWAERRGWVTRNLDAIHFHRGFLRESIVVTTGDILAYGNSCWPWFPLPSVVLEPDGSEDALLAMPRVRRIRALRLRRWDSPDHALEFAGSSELANLERLDLTDLHLTDSDAEYLLRPELFPELKEVRLRVLDATGNGYVAGCLTADIDTSDAHLARFCRRLEERFEKVVWHAER